MMTLEEAIRHCEDVANDKCGCAEDCAEEHRQLAEWLKELLLLREKGASDDSSETDSRAMADKDMGRCFA